MSEKPGSFVEGQEAEEPVDAEVTQEPSGSKSREIDGGGAGINDTFKGMFVFGTSP